MQKLIKQEYFNLLAIFLHLERKTELEINFTEEGGKAKNCGVQVLL